MATKYNYETIAAKAEEDLHTSESGGWVIRKEAAELLGVDVRTFRRWERLGATPFGDLPYRQHRYYRRPDIEALATMRRSVKLERLAKRGGPKNVVIIPAKLNAAS